MPPRSSPARSGRPGNGQVEAKKPPAPRLWLSDAGDLALTREEFPAWDIFRGLHYFWMARLRDAEPALTIRAEELHVLRHRIYPGSRAPAAAGAEAGRRILTGTSRGPRR